MIAFLRRHEIAAFGALYLALHLITNGIWGFHRDELHYLALGSHPDWGYWSNPPLIGLFGVLLDFLPGASPWVVRLVPSLFGAGLFVLAGSMAREMGGGRPAVAMACLGVLLSPAYLRGGMLFQPVIIDIFAWSLCAFLILRYLHTERSGWLWYLGAAIGIGMLNKYSMAFFVLGCFVALLLTPERRLFARGPFFAAIGLALVIVLPNLIWQVVHGFPVVTHMQELRETQLVNVRPQDFLLEQVLMHLPVAWLWLLGLLFVFSARGKSYRALGWIFVSVLLFLLMLGGKSYYTLGLYPMLFAAGAVWLEEHARRGVQAASFGLGVVVLAAISPFAVPYLNVTSMVAYTGAFVTLTGVDAPARWEDGRGHPLPQDYADMLGWEEMAALIDEAFIAAGDSAGVMLYCENYGQAGAATHFYGRSLPEPVSFSDTYRLWAPRSLNPSVNVLIYVNDELGDDVAALFEDIRLVGTVETPFAREAGTKVYLCRRPRSSFPEFWKQRVSWLDGE